MNIKDYQINAARTSADLGSTENNLFHMNMGIHTEVGEVLDIYKKFFAYGKPIDVVHLTEELGDICWYLANKDTFRGITYSADAIDFDGINANNTQEEFYEQKHGVFEAWLNHIVCSTKDYWALVYITCRAYDIDFEQMLEININKLKARYPEKFTEEAALNRDLEQERNVLEGRLN